MYIQIYIYTHSCTDIYLFKTFKHRDFPTAVLNQRRVAALIPITWTFRCLWSDSVTREMGKWFCSQNTQRGNWRFPEMGDSWLSSIDGFSMEWPIHLEPPQLDPMRVFIIPNVPLREASFTLGPKKKRSEHVSTNPGQGLKSWTSSPAIRVKRSTMSFFRKKMKNNVFLYLTYHHLPQLRFEFPGQRSKPINYSSHQLISDIRGKTTNQSHIHTSQLQLAGNYSGQSPDCRCQAIHAYGGTSKVSLRRHWRQKVVWPRQKLQVS